MDFLVAFTIAFILSFIGSVPPGTLNLTVLQLGLDHKLNIAWRFALAVALIEYPYAWVAVKFESLITSSPLVTENFQLLSGIVMIGLGAFNLWAAYKPTKFHQRFNESGFRRGIILSVLNPLVLPYWIGVTAYMKSQQWIDISSELSFHSYLLGTSVGVLVLLMTLAYLGKRIASAFQQSAKLNLVPGITLLLLGVYALIEYTIEG
ncbi:MAG: LysE family translocator [Bacteroidota bacterium]